MRITRVEQVIDMYKTNFPMGWVDLFNWDEVNGEASLIAVKDKVKAFDDETFYLLSQSILAGEYLIKQNYITEIESLCDLFQNGEIFDDESHRLKTIAVSTFNAISFELVRVLRDFRHLLTILDNKYAERQTKFILNAYRVKKEVTLGSKYAQYYEILIGVTRIDHLLSSDKGTITDLILYHSELSKEINNPKLVSKNNLVLDILNEKCLFLLKKLLVEDNKEFDFLIDFRHKHYDTSKMPFKYFSELDKRFEFYRTESYKNDPLGNELDVKVRTNNLKIGLYSLLMKYYKDSKNTSSMQIDNIIKEFDCLYDGLSVKFTKRPLDKYALGTLKNYMYNCRFSFKMQNPSYTFLQLQEDLNCIVNIQYQTGILNYYPYRKAFQKALQLLHNNLDLQHNSLIEYKKFLQLCIDKFSEAMQWCRAYYFYPVQMLYNECLVPVVGFGAVFVASSFCRPVKYQKLKDELISFKNQALLVDNEIALREEKEELKRLKTEIDHSRTKEIEILSVFTAIITFLFGTIGFFAENKNNDFIHLVYSIFGLGAILLIFVSGIHILTMRKEKTIGGYFIHPRMWYCIITIVVSFALLIWLIRNVNTM